MYEMVTLVYGVGLSLATTRFVVDYTVRPTSTLLRISGIFYTMLGVVTASMYPSIMWTFVLFNVLFITGISVMFFLVGVCRHVQNCRPAASRESDDTGQTTGGTARTQEESGSSPMGLEEPLLSQQAEGGDILPPSAICEQTDEHGAERPIGQVVPQLRVV